MNVDRYDGVMRGLTGITDQVPLADLVKQRDACMNAWRPLQVACALTGERDDDECIAAYRAGYAEGLVLAAEAKAKL